jgi:hypothetical protein
MLDLQQIWASYLYFFSIVHFQIDDREVGSCQKVDSGKKDWHPVVKGRSSCSALYLPQRKPRYRKAASC